MSMSASPLSLRPSPLDLGGLLSNSLQVLKQRLGLFVLLALFPIGVGLVLTGVAFGVGAAILVPAFLAPDFSPERLGQMIGQFVLIGVLLLLAGVVSGLVQWKATAMMDLATKEIADGLAPSFGSLWRGTAGVTRRLIGLYLAYFLLTLVAYALVFGYFTVVMIQFVAVGVSGEDPTQTLGGQLAAAIGVLILGSLLLGVLGVFLAVKLLYLIPVLAIERRGAIDSLKRSWRLTDGAFWRTLGYALIGSVIVGLASSVVNYVSQLVSSGMTRGIEDGDYSAILAGVMPVFFVSSALSAAVRLITQPFLAIYTAQMYLDQVQRTDHGVQPMAFYPGGYAGQPGYPAPQNPGWPAQNPSGQYGQPYGQPQHGPGYGQPQYGPGYGQPQSPNGYGQGQYGQGQYGQGQYGQNQYGQYGQGQYGGPGGQPGPNPGPQG